jgi:Na+-transporting methylmalonyl-CoA/oxaloacetate decarboxylase gamma subunit
MLAVQFDNLLFLLLLVLAGLFQLLGRAARKRSGEGEKQAPKPAPQMAKPIPRAATESDQERIRKFLEALGNPPASPPPPPVTQRPTYRKPLVLPRIPPIASPLPPLVTRPPELPSEIEIHREAAPSLAQQPQPARTLLEPIFQIHQAVAPPELVPVGTATVPQAKRQKQLAASPSVIDAITLLGSAMRLRDAIILREIFGPPRGLREPEVL